MQLLQITEKRLPAKRKYVVLPCEVFFPFIFIKSRSVDYYRNFFKETTKRLTLFFFSLIIAMLFFL